MTDNINKRVAHYQKQLASGELHTTYEFLVKYLMQVKATFEKKLGATYLCGNISPGYLDFTYFSFFDPELRAKKLRFGVVLNHHEMRFELWLMGQNAAVQKEYWKKMKTSRWNAGVGAMPKDSIVETILVEAPDFSAPEELATTIVERANRIADEILNDINVLG